MHFLIHLSTSNIHLMLHGFISCDWFHINTKKIEYTITVREIKEQILIIAECVKNEHTESVKRQKFQIKREIGLYKSM